MWEACYLREDEEGPETLDVETVIDRDLFRSSDGSAANTARTLHLPLDYFATFEVATLNPEGLPGITITYAKLAEFLDQAERLQRIRQPALGEKRIGKKSSRQTRKRKRRSTPPEQLSSDRERDFRNAESKVEGRTVVEDGDFEHRTREGIDIPERRQSRRMRLIPS
ncbi:hypothetical protein V493_00464 [Pseudogymnoascus sp. VKM F-4281 (FW-2241)]|nr:hypothetical protein V493_00464 [Pseudogymnoascus sp. VKM F-4281 (FW-2241)]